ncbi:hypothetical protein [Shewanella waksmanii]|uniref:hypothetical protein n=1 Tax=Shewanella waksmanii TaxID=213783 RepID=UPI0037352C0C
MQLISLLGAVLILILMTGCGANASYHVTASSDEDVMSRANGTVPERVDEKIREAEELERQQSK